MQLLDTDTQSSTLKHATSETFVLEGVGDVGVLSTLRTPLLSVQITGTFVGELFFEASNTGDAWYPHPLNINGGADVLSVTTAGLYETVVVATFFRVRAGTLTSGSPSVTILRASA